MTQAVVPAFKSTETLQDGTTIDPMTGEIISMPEAGSNSALRDAAPSPELDNDNIVELPGGTVIDFKSEKVLVPGNRVSETIGGVDLTLHSPEWESLIHSIVAVEYYNDESGRWKTEVLTAGAKKVYCGILRLYKRQGDDMPTITLNSTEIARESGVSVTKVAGALHTLKICKFAISDRRSRGYFIFLPTPAQVMKMGDLIAQEYSDVDHSYIQSRYGKQPTQKPDLKVVKVD